MPIRISEFPEPRSEQGRSNAVLLVESDAARLLRHELRRYCNGEVTGRSFLIAGHRGAGKTTMVESAWLDVWRANRDGESRLRPLYVQVDGPSLFPDDALIADGANRGNSTAARDQRADAKSKPADKPAVKVEDDDQQAAAAAVGQHAQTTPESTAKPKDPIQLTLEQLILALHRAVAAEFSRGYWERITSPRPGDSASRIKRRRREMQPELAAQFQAELSEWPSPSRLRQFYANADLLRLGVLDRYDGVSTQGSRELVALSGVCEAYRRISGTSKLEETLKDEAKREAEAKATLDSTNTKLVQSVIALLTGAAVGVGTGQAVTPAAGVLSGVVTALAASLVIKGSAARSRTRNATREYSFLFDLTIDTLGRILPALIDSLLAAGLAPVFVIDELDKVDKLNTRLLRMVNQLKKLVAESAFFCFLTDRLYFEQMTARQHQFAYPVEYTYFTHRLYVVFRPSDCHAYLDGILETIGGSTQSSDTGPLAVAPAPADGGAVDAPLNAAVQMATAREAVDRSARRASAPDALDREVLPWVVLHRARLHTVDMRRLLQRWRDWGGYLQLRTGEVRTSMAYRLDVLLQVAIEAVLDGDEFRALLTNDPDLRRLAHDAMYYITRAWVDLKRTAKPIELDLSNDAAAIKRFRTYLTDRLGTDEQAHKSDAPAAPPVARKGSTKKGEEPAAKQVDLLAAIDVDFLYSRVDDLAQLLAHPARLRTAVETWRRGRVERGEPDIPTSVLETIRLPLSHDGAAAQAGGGAGDADASPLQLLEEIPDAPAHRYYWRFDPSGVRLRIPGEQPAPAPSGEPAAEWERDAGVIEAWAKALREIAA